MKQVTVLVTGIGGPIAQGVLKGLKQLDFCYLIGADRRDVTAGHQFCDETYSIPSLDSPEEYRRSIQQLVKEHEIDAIFPGLHGEMSLYSKEFIEQLGVPVALPKSEVWEILFSKAAIYSYLQQLGITEHLPFYKAFQTNSELKDLLSSDFVDDELVVVKSIDGHGATGFVILASRERYIQAIENGEKAIIARDDYLQTNLSNARIIMKYLPGQEYSVDLYIHNKNVVITIPRERTGVSNGLVLDGQVVYNEKLITASETIASKLISDGFINLQFIQVGDNYELTDINPRFCGSQVMSLGAGVNFPSLFIHYHVLRKSIYPTPKWNVRMLRFRDEIYVESSEIT